jgi:hypothetical protein
LREVDKPVTVCIAAASENGRYIVSAVDAMLSYGNVQGDVGAHKIMWMSDWQLMFAGDLANGNMVREELANLFIADSGYCTRARIQDAVCIAYKKRMAAWSANRFLMQYQLTMQDFLERGREIFDDERFADLTNKIEADIVNYTSEVIVTGFGHSEISAMLYSINRDGDSSNSLAGWVSAGSGSSVANTMLMLSGYTMACPLEHAIYQVAAAKFAAESVAGVGRATTMFVSRKRAEADDPHDATGFFIQPDQIERLRSIWEEHGRIRLPQNIGLTIHKMIREHKPKVSAAIAFESVSIAILEEKVREEPVFKREPEMPPTSQKPEDHL